MAEQLREPEAAEEPAIDRDEVTTCCGGRPHCGGRWASRRRRSTSSWRTIRWSPATRRRWWRLGPADRQALLAAPTVPARWRLRALLVDQIGLLQARLAAG